MPKRIAANLKPPETPSVRLAVGIHTKGSVMSPKNVSRALKTSEESQKPAVLVSFVYLKKFLQTQEMYHIRDWVLDSGAFSAHASGTTIDLDEYIETCLRLLKEDPTLTEVFALDVIGDWKATAKNVDKMWAAGVPAVPTFHAGSPESELIRIARDYPKIALGGVALAKSQRKIAWAEQCFARVWPKKIHGFAFGTAASILRLPFHSVDATNWELGPCAFGRWQSFGHLSVRGGRTNLRAEVEFYLKLERQAWAQWKREMKLIDDMDEDTPAVRLALSGGEMRRSGESGPAGRIPAAFHKKHDGSGDPKPAVRLAFGGREFEKEALKKQVPAVRLALDANSGAVNEDGMSRRHEGSLGKRKGKNDD